MFTYLIVCDFRGSVEKESAVAELLNRFLGLRIKQDTWLIKSSEPVSAVTEKLESTGIYLCVARVDSGCVMLQPGSVVRWLKKNQFDIL